MFGCEEQNLERVLPPTKFVSNKATERLFNLLEHLSTQAYNIGNVHIGV